jgi:hypothetical protein
MHFVEIAWRTPEHEQTYNNLVAMENLQVVVNDFDVDAIVGDSSLTDNLCMCCGADQYRLINVGPDLEHPHWLCEECASHAVTMHARCLDD